MGDYMADDIKYSYDMTTLGGRFKWARRRAKVTQNDVAAAVGCSRNALSQWENDVTPNPNLRNLDKAAARLGVSARWLETGQGNPFEETSPRKVRRVPLINWTAMRDFNPTSPHDGDYIETTANDATCALTVESNHMAPAIPKGAVVIVQLGRKPEHGNYVIFAHHDGGAPILRRLIQDGAGAFMESGDPRLPLIPESAGTILAVVLRIEIDALR